MLLRYFSFFVLRYCARIIFITSVHFCRSVVEKRGTKKREREETTQQRGIPFFLFSSHNNTNEELQEHKMQQETRDERAQKKEEEEKKKPANQHQQKEEKKGAIVVFVFICIERLLSLWRLESRLRWTTTTRYYSRKRAALFSERVSRRKRERICAFFSKGDVRFFFLEILNDCEKETAFEI